MVRCGSRGLTDTNLGQPAVPKPSPPTGPSLGSSRSIYLVQTVPWLESTCVGNPFKANRHMDPRFGHHSLIKPTTPTLDINVGTCSGAQPLGENHLIVTGNCVFGVCNLLEPTSSNFSWHRNGTSMRLSGRANRQGSAGNHPSNCVMFRGIGP